MRAELKSMHSPDIDLPTFWPEKPDSFGFLMQVMIGPEGQEGTESFDIQVCTPKWLIEKHKPDDVLFGTHMLIVFEYDVQRIQGFIQRYCQRCIGNSWQDIVPKLARIGGWEFEDYH